MADIKDRIAGLVKAMRDISAQSDMSEADLKTFIQILESIGGVSGQFAPKMSKIAEAIQKMSTALASVGASESYITRLKTSLMGLAESYERAGVASQKMQSLKGSGLVGREEGMRAFEQEQARQAEYYRKALISTGQVPLTSGGGADISDQLGGRATQLRLADELQKKIIAQAVAERQVTLEIEAQNQALDSQKIAFAQQPGLGQAYGRMTAEPVAPPVMTPEQIRVDQDARYEALKQEAITPRKQLFDSSTQLAEREAEAVQKLAMEVQKLEEAYSRTYSGRLKAGKENAIAQADREAKLLALQVKGEQAKGDAPLSKAGILQAYAPQIPGGETGMANLEKQLDKYGVTSARVTSVTQEMSNGITSMSLSMDKGNNVTARGTIHMDQYGNVLQDTSRRFRSFSDAVGTNILKVTQWAVATGLVYGVVRQLGQVFTEITDIQSKLASVQIALGSGQGDLNRVFEEALTVANLTSSSVAGVVEAYAIAYRATGSYSTEVERVAVANSILQESMILAELAGVDQAVAMDTLVGALRQTGMELDQGRDLLDKWVHVSRQANVSLDTLAQTYAIVGSTAQGVGIEMEELNAIAATLAEATGLSATETGNAVRGIVAGFQSASSEKTLARFGIATRDATGQLRDFMGLYQELAVLTQSGILSDRDISEIANAIGGGYRRGAQVETLLKNSSRVAQITAGQSEAGGAAAEALGIQMATLESAITRLGNAFTKFAQTLGSEGGFLTVITSIVDAMSGLLNMVTGLAAGLGKATPYLAAFVAAWTVLGSTRGQDMFKGIINKPLGGMLTQGLGAVGIGRPLAEQQMMDARAGGYYAMQRPPQMTVGGAFTGARTGLAGKMGGLDPMALVAPILIAGSAFMSAAKMKEEDPTGAGLEAGRGVTSIIGAIAGGIITAGNPLGIAAGSAMASAFYKGVVQYEDDLAGYWAGIMRKAADEVEEDEGPGAQDAISFGARLFAGITSGAGKAAQWLSTGGTGGLLGTGIGTREGMADLDPRAFITGMAQERLADKGEGPAGLGMETPFKLFADLLLTEEQAEAILEEVQNVADATAIEIQVETDMTEGIKELKPMVGPILDDFMQEMQRKLQLGEIDLQEFIKLPQILDTTKLATQMQKIVTAGDFARMSIDVKEFTGFMLELDETTRNYVGKLADDVVSAHTAWRSEVELNKLSLEELMALEDEYNEKRQRFQEMVPVVQQAHEVSQIERTPIFQAGRLSQDQISMAAKAAQAYTRSYYMKIAEGNEENAQVMIDQLEPFLIQSGEGLGATFGQTIGGTTAEAMAQAIKDYDWDDLLSDIEFGFQDIRDSMSMEDIPDLMSRYNKVVGTFQTFFPDYDVEEQDVGLITKDGLTTVHADLTLLNLAMQDLIDVSEQQLEGVWNIPAGMTAMVAWSSLFTREGGGGGTTAGDGEVWTEDRQDVTGTDIETLTSLDAQLAALNAAILDFQTVIAMGPEELGMQEIIASQADLARLETERDELLKQIAQTSVGGALGIEATSEMSVADQLREALTIQNKIEFNTNIRLVVDGRTLASIIKQYLYEDLVSAADKTTGTGSGDYVIGH